MNLGTICDEISYLVNDTTLSSTGTNAARTKAWVREVYFLDIFTLRNDWWFLKTSGTFNTVVGTTVYSLPNAVPNVKNVKKIVDADDYEIGFTHYDRSSGTDRIEIDFTPASVEALKVIGIDVPASLTDLTDTPTLPEEWHYLLVKGGVVKALKHNQDPNLEVELAEYQAALKRLCAQNNRDDYRTESWWN